MPKESAFAKAKVKKAGGGFGASKSGRFDGPKESWEQGPSSTSYDYDLGSIGGKLKKDQQRSQLIKSIKGKDRAHEVGGFGSSAPKFEKNGKFNGMGSDAPGPGAYADGVQKVRSTFDGTKSKGRGFGSESKDRFSLAGTGFAREETPAVGEYLNVGSGMGDVKKKFQSKSRSHGFGGAARFESKENGMGPQEVVQADYNVESALPGIAKDATKSTAGVRAKGGFGSAAPKFEKVAEAGSGLGPGAYDWSKATGAFVAPVTPSAAFASKSDQHSTTPGASSKSNGMGATEAISKGRRLASTRLTPASMPRTSSARSRSTPPPPASAPPLPASELVPPRGPRLKRARTLRDRGSTRRRIRAISRG